MLQVLSWSLMQAHMLPNLEPLQFHRFQQVLFFW
jgi:hypothetical protein